jgi:methionyl-tRNA synthetase
MAAAAGRFLNAEFSAWNSTLTPLLGSALNRYVPLATRLDPAKVADLVEAPAAVVDVPSALVASPVPGATGVAAVKTVAPPPSSINIADFQKIDIRIARVAAAATVEGSDKLVRLTLELGDSQRQVFSGIRKAYPPEQLVGRHVLLVANLEPRKMRFGVSEGMVLCAGDESTGLFLLAPDSGATAGMKVS